MTELAQRSRDPEEKYTLFANTGALVIVLVKILWESVPESFRFDRREIRAGRNKAAGKFSRLRASARFTAMNAHAIQRSATHGSAPAMVPPKFRCSMNRGT